MSRQQIISILSFIVAVLLGVNAYLIVGGKDVAPKQEKSIGEYTAAVVETCRDASHRAFCYETEIPKLLSDVSSQEIFAIIRAVREADSGYVFCHVLAHKIGEYEVAKDPENWLSVLANGPVDGLCSNGYAHGAIMARFNVAAFDETQMATALPDINRACLPRAGYEPTALQMAMCYHGLGHVFVHLTDADVPRGLAACREVTKDGPGAEFATQCVEGVYMQLFQPLEPEDTALIEKLPYAPTRSTVGNFCREQSSSEEEFATCWREAWPLFSEEMKSAVGITAYCGELEEGEGREACFISAYTINGRHHLEDPETMAQICNEFEVDAAGSCFSRGANAFLEEDPNLIEDGVTFCARAEASSAQDTCYTFLSDIGGYNFHSGGAYHERLCRALPTAYQTRCNGS